ncbi:ATP-dependent RNA helicase dbp4 [Friedmanniomyces endolithicus]|nr:ATP-dependent RNA helicase dbp4 [Friedmanniomyces endolithicus]
MAPQPTGRTRPTKPKKPQRNNKRKRDDVDVEALESAVAELDPKATYTTFAELPLSEPTREGLKSAHFSTLTDIQAKAVPLALKGRDILGAAKTGSGKTLAFLIPVLENLYRAQCIGGDAGLGAMVISPTRELAIQIFEVLRTIGRKGHIFAAGLVIGGKSLREEQDALARMNIVVCTPGRILQHLSQTAAFNVDNLRMLVLDEADRILDMGFSRDLDAIIEYLPTDRQTLLFSATQTKKVGDLARLSLRDPEYVSVHEAATAATPATLQQNYVLTPIPEKLDTLWSFITSSKKSKILVFLSSGKQVRFVYEAFRHMQPGIPLLHLHGRQKQTARLDITDRFRRAQHSCLFATDVVARGIDFPAVDWVVQVDCPEDADTYIHRVGRTARYEREGRAVLFLDPSEEEGMLKRLEQKRVPIERISVRGKKQISVKKQVQSMCFQDPQLKYLGQKAFASYTRSLHVQKDREVFDLQKYDLEGFAASLGLPGAPRIKFLRADAEEVKRRKNAPRMGPEVDDDVSADGDDEEGEMGVERVKVDEKNGVRTKYDRMFERKNQDVLAEHYAKMVKTDGDAGGEDVDMSRLDGEQAVDDDLFDVKRRIPAGEGSPVPSLSDIDDADEASVTGDPATGTSRTVHLAGAKDPLIIDSKRREKLLKSKKKLLKLKDKGSRVVFDDEGLPHQVYEMQDDEAFRSKGAAEEQRRQYVDAEAERVREQDGRDKVLAKEKKREKREKRKERERAAEEEEEDGVEKGEDDGTGVGLLGGEDAMANFLADAQASGSDFEEEADVEVEEQPPKKQKKWFQKDVRRDSDDEVGAGKEIGTFDELEAEAARLLG